ncbi:MAG TPA: DUF937 domain-containing protein [Vicinamibacterales bacterium]|nr:DUF937 domain-containing protein [Vicinamibacterales bacterium]
MDLLQTILNAQDGAAVQQLGDQVGLDQNQTMAAVQQLVPALAAGLAHNTNQPGGLDALMAALSGGGHQQYINDPSVLGAAETVQDGNGILGHIFGSKDVSRQVAAQASANTGISADVLKQMLPLVATLAMGAMARRHASAPAGAQTADTGLMGMLGPLLGGGSAGGSGGSGAGDLMGMLGKLLR